jgi:hypothetical protein
VAELDELLQTGGGAVKTITHLQSVDISLNRMPTTNTRSSTTSGGGITEEKTSTVAPGMERLYTDGDTDFQLHNKNDIAPLLRESIRRRDAILQFIRSPRCTLFGGSPLVIYLDGSAVDRLVDESGAALEALNHIITFNQQDKRYNYFNELIAAIREAHTPLAMARRAAITAAITNATIPFNPIALSSPSHDAQSTRDVTTGHGHGHGRVASSSRDVRTSAALTPQHSHTDSKEIDASTIAEDKDQRLARWKGKKKKNRKKNQQTARGNGNGDEDTKSLLDGDTRTSRGTGGSSSTPASASRHHRTATNDDNYRRSVASSVRRRHEADEIVQAR